MSGRRSEREPQGELGNSRIERILNASEIGVGDVRNRVHELGVVEHIEKLGAEFQTTFLP